MTDYIERVLVANVEELLERVGKIEEWIKDYELKNEKDRRHIWTFLNITKKQVMKTMSLKS